MKDYQPPKLPLKIFRYFCSDDRLEELEGDLYEVYYYFIEERGAKFSKLFYWWIVLRSFRSYALKRTKSKNKGLMNSMTHLRHNLIIGWRNLVKNRAIASINIIGLAIGIGAFIAIFSIVRYEQSFNAKISDGDQVHRIYSSFSGSFTSQNRGVPVPVGPYVEETFSGLDYVSYFQT
ncbi:MAG: permease prefix domain 2-containing transporter, partial [Bacteroidota bacterium]